MKVKCVNIIPIDMDDPTYPDLIDGNIYEVIDIYNDYYTIIGNMGYPFGYGSRRFVIVDDTMEPDWVEVMEDDVKNIAPPDFYDGLFEDYHEYVAEAIEYFNRYMLKRFNRKVGDLEGIKFLPGEENQGA